MAGAIRFVDVVGDADGVESRRIGWLFSELVPPPPSEDFSWWHKWTSIEPTPDQDPPPHGRPWGPWIPNPNPFNQLATQNLIPERVPMRLNQAVQKRPGPNFSENPKTDPRSVRFTEKVGTILGALVRSGTIAPTATDQWRVIMIPRVANDTEAFNGEIYIDSGTGQLKWKDLGGAPHTIV